MESKVLFIRGFRWSEVALKYLHKDCLTLNKHRSDHHNVVCGKMRKLLRTYCKNLRYIVIHATCAKARNVDVNLSHLIVIFLTILVMQEPFN